MVCGVGLVIERFSLREYRWVCFMMERRRECYDGQDFVTEGNRMRLLCLFSFLEL